MKRVAKWSMAVAATMVMASGCASFDEWQRRAIFQPEPAAATVSAPQGVEEFDLKLTNGQHVRAWYLSAADETGSKSKADAPTVLFLHGARRNLYNCVNRLQRLQSMGFNVLAVDYRGFGRSTDILPSGASVIEDSEAAYTELLRRQPDPSKRLLYGYSLGGALAIELAAKHDHLAGVVIESSFTSIADVVEASKWGWVPGVRWLLRHEFNSLARVAQVNEPLLFVHGTADDLVPAVMSDRLAAAATSVPAQFKRVLKVEGARHQGAMALGAERYVSAMREFLQLASTASGGTGLSSGVHAGVMMNTAANASVLTAPASASATAATGAAMP